MVSVLSDDLVLVIGVQALDAMPGAQGGRFADLGVLNATRTLALSFRPDVPTGTRAINATEVVDETPADLDACTLAFTFPPPWHTQPQRIVLRRGPTAGLTVNGTPTPPCRVHEVDFSAVTWFGQYVLRFFDGVQQRRAVAWKHAN